MNLPRLYVRLILFLAATLAASAHDGPWQSLYRGELAGGQVLLAVSVAPDDQCSCGLFLPDSVAWISFEGPAGRSSLLHLKQVRSDGEITTASALDVHFDRRRTRAHALWKVSGGSDIPIELERIATYTGSDVRSRRLEITASYPVFENLPDGIDRKTNRLIHSFLVQKAREEGVEPGARYEGVVLSTDLSMSVSWIDSAVVSLVCDVEAVTGAPHLNHWTKGMTILLDRAAPRRLRLKDLIRTDTNTLCRIGATCRERESIMGEEEESDKADAGNGDDALAEFDPGESDVETISNLQCVETFVLLRDGIEFIWMEAEMEPPHYALIPYRLLAPVINPDGPLVRYLRARR